MPDQIDDIELRSEEVQEILTRAPNWMIRWGSALFLALIILLLAISWFLKYPDIIASQAIITTQVPPQKEIAKSSGRFSAILIEDREQVYKGQTLAVIENTAHYEDVFKLKSIVDTISLQSDSFSFPFESIPVLFLGDIESEYALFENNYNQYDLNRKYDPFSSRKSANRIAISENKVRLQNAEAQLENDKLNLKYAKKDLERSRELFRKGVDAPVDMERKEQEYLQAENNFKSQKAALSQLRESVSGARNASDGTDYDSRREEISLFNGVIQSFDQLKRSIRDWELRYTLTSKLDGEVSFLDFWSENQTVNAGDVVFTIIPKDGSEYVAKLKTPAQNSGKIKVGQDVIIRVDNYPDTEFGTLEGKIEKISVIADEDGMYAIDVSLPETLITTFDKEIDFQQEMRGTGDIVTEDLRLIERFFYQLRDIFKR